MGDAMRWAATRLQACRACKKFERNFDILAEKYPQVRFITVNLDQNKSTAKLGEELVIEGTPTFIFYKGCVAWRDLLIRVCRGSP